MKFRGQAYDSIHSNMSDKNSTKSIYFIKFYKINKRSNIYDKRKNISK